jgi:hypothetical protein
MFHRYQAFEEFLDGSASRYLFRLARIVGAISAEDSFGAHTGARFRRQTSQLRGT